MAKVLRTLLLHALQRIQALISRLTGFEFKRKTASLLPITSPTLGSKIIITKFSPLGQRASSGFTSSNSAWLQDKERFLRCPTLMRSPTGFQNSPERKRRDMKIELVLPRPEICIEDWSSPEIPLSDLQDPTSNTASSGPVPTTTHTDKSSGVQFPPPIKEGSMDDKYINIKPARVNEVSDLNVSPSPTKSPPLRAEKVRLTFEPIQRTPNAHSAVGNFFYDPPSHTVPASMVPVPLFTNSPTLGCSDASKDGGIRLSLLPYPDLFDFAMYDARASQESSIGLRISLSPTNVTVTTDSSTVLESTPISFRDRYRNSAYSRLNGLCTPAKANPLNIKIAPSSDRVVLRPKTKRLGGLPLDTISFNTPTRTSHMSTPPAFKVQDSASLYSSPNSSEDWNIMSLDDIGTRLRDACSDLSRCAWTEEEFLRIISP